MKIRIEAMGEAPLIAEYDAQRQTIRVNKRMVERMRARYGEAAASDLVRCAVAHERYHAEHPGCSEAEAHAFAYAQTQCDPRLIEAAVRR
jgi:hypothetical protein